MKSYRVESVQTGEVYLETNHYEQADQWVTEHPATDDNWIRIVHMENGVPFDPFAAINSRLSQVGKELSKMMRKEGTGTR